MRTRRTWIALAVFLAMSCSSSIGEVGAAGAGGSGGSGGGGSGGSCFNWGWVSLQLGWTLTKGGSAATCDSFPGQQGLEVVFTGAPGTEPWSRTFPCEAGAAEIFPIGPGTYTVSVALVDADHRALASSDPQSLDLTFTGCDAVGGDICNAAQCIHIVSTTLR